MKIYKFQIRLDLIGNFDEVFISQDFEYIKEKFQNKMEEYQIIGTVNVVEYPILDENLHGHGMFDISLINGLQCISRITTLEIGEEYNEYI